MFFRKKRQTDQPRRVRMTSREGLGAQPVFSYHARSARAESTGTRQASKLLWASPAKASPRRPERSWPRRTIVIGAAILVGALMVNSLFLGRSPSIVPIAETTGRRLMLRSQDEYHQAARAILGDSLANTNKLTVDTTRIAEAMEKQFPELEQVSIALPVVGHQPVVYILPAEPVLLFKATSGGVFVLDRSGRTVKRATQAVRLEKLGLPVVEDQSSLPIDLGRTALPSDDVAFITEVVSQLKAKNLKVAALVLPQGTSELDIRLEGAAYIVKFNLRGDARAEVGTFLATKQHLERESKTPGSYVDVRVDNKAYYR